jgi:hypothetical protein
LIHLKWADGAINGASRNADAALIRRNCFQVKVRWENVDER